jgi:predicted permease
MARWPDRVFQALLRLFPREFRGDFGEQMAADFEDQRRDARRTADRGRLWGRTLTDVVRRAPAEHLDVLRQDVSFAVRLMRRTPGAAAAIVITIAVGVGATTAVFTLADPMLFRPLPYPEGDRLVRLSARADVPRPAMHVPDFLRARAEHTGFEAIALFGISLVGPIEGGAQTALAYDVTEDFFRVVRVWPFLGRVFVEEEFGAAAAPEAAILTFGFWHSAFGGRPDVLDRSFTVGPRRFRVVGVLPRGFVVPDHSNRAPDFLVPQRLDPAVLGNPNRLAFPIARLRPGVHRDAAAAEMQGILRAVEREFPQFGGGREPVVRDLRESLFGSVRTPLLLLLAATGSVLILACANLAHLFMGRLQARRREFGVRLALGAGRWRLIRLLTIESAGYAVAGGLAALAVARWTFDLIMARTPEFAHVYRLLPAGVDSRVVLFASALAGLALIAFGAIPAFRASRIDVRGALLDGGTATRGERRSRAAAALIAVQCGVAMTLVVTGGLLVHSFARLTSQPLGFEPHAVWAVSIRGPGGLAATPVAEQRRAYEHVRDRSRAPVTAASGWPGLHLPGFVTLPGAEPSSGEVIAYPVAGTFPDVFGVRLVSGRFHSDAEAFDNAPVAVLDRRAAERFWPSQQPLEQVVVDGTGLERRVIGIVETLRTQLRGDEPAGSAFIPIGQPAWMSLAVRPSGGSRWLEDLRHAVAEVMPGADVEARPFQPFERTLGQPRFLAALLGTLNAITLILAAVGIFGVVNHGAEKRTREIGIRLALGATAARIRRMVVTGALVPAALGMAAGAAAALWWTPALQSLLFGIEPSDPLTYAAAAAIVTLVVLAGSLLPAWRVSRAPPTSALRAE